MSDAPIFLSFVRRDDATLEVIVDRDRDLLVQLGDEEGGCSIWLSAEQARRFGLAMVKASEKAR